MLDKLCWALTFLLVLTGAAESGGKGSEEPQVIQVICHINRSLDREMCTLKIYSDRWVMYDAENNEVGVMIKESCIPSLQKVEDDVCINIKCTTGDDQTGTHQVCFPALEADGNQAADQTDAVSISTVESAVNQVDAEPVASETVDDDVVETGNVQSAHDSGEEAEQTVQSEESIAMSEAENNNNNNKEEEEKEEEVVEAPEVATKTEEVQSPASEAESMQTEQETAAEIIVEPSAEPSLVMESEAEAAAPEISAEPSTAPEEEPAEESNNNDNAVEQPAVIESVAEATETMPTVESMPTDEQTNTDAEEEQAAAESTVAEVPETMESVQTAVSMEQAVEEESAAGNTVDNAVEMESAQTEVIEEQAVAQPASENAVAETEAAAAATNDDIPTEPIKENSGVNVLKPKSPNRSPPGSPVVVANAIESAASAGSDDVSIGNQPSSPAAAATTPVKSPKAESLSSASPYLGTIAEPEFNLLKPAEMSSVPASPPVLAFSPIEEDGEEIVAVPADSVKLTGQQVVLDSGMKSALAVNKDQITTLLADDTSKVKVTLTLDAGTWNVLADKVQ